MARPSQPLHPPHAHRLALIRTLTPTLRGMLVGRTGLSPVMVGRSAELARLRGLVGASTTPAVALVAGAAGVGKTRLVKEAVDDAPDGTTRLACQAHPGTVGRPMVPFRTGARRVGKE